MNKLKAYLTLVRWLNLLIIVVILVVLRYGFLVALHFDLYLSHAWFALLVLATVLLAAGGNAVNDAFDVASDRINKPERMVVTVSVSKENALFFGQVLLFAGSVSGLALGYFNDCINFSYIFPMSAILLWLYSTNLKRKPFIGNVVVALLGAIMVANLILFDLLKSMRPENAYNHKQAMVFILGVAAFSFLVTLIRELLKDLQDVEGDKQAGYKTLPITSGQYFPKILVIILVMLTIVALGWIVFMNYLMDDFISAGYLLLFVIAPLFIIMVKIAPAGTAKEYGLLSKLTKLVMVTGVLSILVFTLYAKYLMNQAVKEETTIPPPEEWIIRPAQ